MKSKNSNNNTPMEFDEFTVKMIQGMELTFQKLLEFKKQKNSPLVVMRNGKIVKIMAEDYYKEENKEI